MPVTIDALKMLEAMRSARIAFQTGDHLTHELGSKSWFLLAIRITLIMLDTVAESKGTADEVFEKALRDAE
jgi:hypothetical protein